jgi:hypothetical protein
MNQKPKLRVGVVFAETTTNEGKLIRELGSRYAVLLKQDGSIVGMEYPTPWKIELPGDFVTGLPPNFK